MKPIRLAELLILLGIMSLSNSASAHVEQGSLGTVATATDRWYIQCLDPNTGSLAFQLKKTSGTPCVKATLTLNGKNTSVTSCGALSSMARVPTGTGAKLFTINKYPAAVGAVSYSVRTLCIDKTGIDNPPDNQSFPQIYIQNQ